MKVKQVKITNALLAEFETNATKKEVITILRMNEFEYNNTLFETGIAWLVKNYSHLPSLVEIYKTSKIFWKWYTNQYHIMNCKFIETVNDLSLFKDNTNTLLKLYFKMQMEMSFFLNRTAQKMIYKEYFQRNRDDSSEGLKSNNKPKTNLKW